MSETSYETNLSPVGFIDKTVFDAGMYFCEPLDDIVPGRQYRESRKLPDHERALRTMFDDSNPVELYAEDRIVIVDTVEGHRVSMSDVYRGEGDELVSGRPGPSLTMTPEGWFIPEGLVRDEERAKELFTDIAQIAIGYLSA